MFAHRGIVGQAVGFSLIRSQLFARRYLVAYVESEWLREVEPECEAMASTLSDPVDGGRRPPLVIAPAERKGSRSAVFRSVLEHEFVHVNQVLHGTFLQVTPIVRARDAVVNFMDYARTEYEATLLQLVHNPQMLPTEAGEDFDFWCVLRAYSQALERTIMDLAVQAVTPRRVSRALNMLRAEIADIVEHIGSGTCGSTWFAEHFVDHAAIALSAASRAIGFNLVNPTSIWAIAEWVRKRGGLVQSSSGILSLMSLLGIDGRVHEDRGNVPF